MITQASPFSALRRLHRSAMAWLGTWWRLLHFAVLIVATALTPASYGGTHRPALARRIVIAAAPNLLWFTVLSALVSLVLIRIVVVTALSYGLSRFALEMVVRVLVLELIPLTAALFVALRSTLPAGVEFAQQRGAGGLYPGTTINSAALLHSEFFPRVAAGMFAVWLHAVGAARLHARGRPGVRPERGADPGAEGGLLQRRRRTDSDGVVLLRWHRQPPARHARPVGYGAPVFPHPADRGRLLDGQLLLRP